MADRTTLDPALLRAAFSEALSAMYRAEVPLYGTLLALVAQVNRDAGGAGQPAGGRPAGGQLAGGQLAGGHLSGGTPADGQLANGQLANGQLADGQLADGRLGSERHGAIRVGTPAELALVARLFAVMGMQPVGYYDLAPAGVPVHSTAFRPVTSDELARAPFRMFTSLLRPELIDDPALRQEAASILAARRIGDDRLPALLHRAETENGLPEEDAPALIEAALALFRWHHDATVPAGLYARLRAAHPLVADVVCFRGPHVNHLTPRTLDIDAAQAAMRAAGMNPKAEIEGPPRRRVPVLLRQTSFQALSETVRFSDAPGTHTARFGEIEQRGAALTPAGRTLYDAALATLRDELAQGRPRPDAEASAFAALPDDAEALREGGLAFFSARTGAPLLYEDFLPVSAAGIFRSNLGGAAAGGGHAMPGGDRAVLEAAIGRPILDEMTLYRAEAGG